MVEMMSHRAPYDNVGRLPAMQNGPGSVGGGMSTRRNVENNFEDRQTMRRPRKVLVYCNGDKFFKGKLVHIMPNRYRNFGDLLGDLTGQLSSSIHLTYGVRQVFTPTTGRKINSVSEMQNGQNYVCAGFETFKAMPYGTDPMQSTWPPALVEKQTADSTDTLPQSSSSSTNTAPPNSFHPRRYHIRTKHPTNGRPANGSLSPTYWGPTISKETGVNNRPKVITIIHAGSTAAQAPGGGLERRGRQNIKILLNRSSVQSYEQFMKDIADAFGPSSMSAATKLRRLYTIKGREVQGISDFFREDDVFIGVSAFDEPSLVQVREILNEVYPDSPYVRTLMRKWYRAQRYRYHGARPMPRTADPTLTTDTIFEETTPKSERRRLKHHQAQQPIPVSREAFQPQSSPTQSGTPFSPGAEDAPLSPPVTSPYWGAGRDTKADVLTTRSNEETMRSPNPSDTVPYPKSRIPKALRHRRHPPSNEEVDNNVIGVPTLQTGELVETPNGLAAPGGNRGRRAYAIGDRSRVARLKPLGGPKPLPPIIQQEEGVAERMSGAENESGSRSGRVVDEEMESGKVQGSKDVFPVTEHGRNSRPMSNSVEMASPAAQPVADGIDVVVDQSVSPTRIGSRQSRSNSRNKTRDSAAAATRVKTSIKDEDNKENLNLQDETISNELNGTTPLVAPQSPPIRDDVIDVMPGSFPEVKSGSRSQSPTTKRPSTRVKSRPKSIVYKSKFERQISNTGRILERFELGQILGDGNFAIVRLCSERGNLGREFALKIIDKAKLKGKEMMIENEIAIMKACRHPNIVRLLEEYETQAEIYLIMELIKGGDLFDAITQRTKFPELESSGMVSDLANALYYLHSRGIVHRDLKPENVMVQQNADSSITLKLADFGLAMEVHDNIYTVCGTPTYVAPEILAETGYGLEIDLWALGVILYILLCGFPPFRSAERKQTELFEYIKGGQFEFTKPYWDNVSESPKDLITRLLVVDRKKRYTSIDTLCHPFLTTRSGSLTLATDPELFALARRRELETQAAADLQTYRHEKLMARKRN